MDDVTNEAEVLTDAKKGKEGKKNFEAVGSNKKSNLGVEGKGKKVILRKGKK